MPVAWMLAALPRRIAIDNLWRSQEVSLLSPVTPVMRFPNSSMNFELDLPITPVVSIASGLKM